jgi:glycosyltransferase involved in cell wall biosynthesis
VIRALVLMSRLSDYMLHCLTLWSQTYRVELHVVRRKVDRDAPFAFSNGQADIHLYRREDFDAAALRRLAHDLSPGLIICFGWMDGAYLSTVRNKPPTCRTVMTMDNQWLGTARQHIGLFWSRVRLRPIFDDVWVPGPRQQRFARRLGFPADRVHDGLYVANATHFDPLWRGLGAAAPRKRLVFTGRYALEKGLDELWDAFVTYHASQESDLELWCVGTGPLEAQKPDHPKIRHLGFVQPGDLRERLDGCGVFILPSRFEPWGLVVQEFALAGFPLVLSPHVGAADRFLGPENGLLLTKVSKDALIAAIAAIDVLSEAELAAMSAASRAKAERPSPSDWARQANEFLRTPG